MHKFEYGILFLKKNCDDMTLSTKVSSAYFEVCKIIYLTVFPFLEILHLKWAKIRIGRITYFAGGYLNIPLYSPKKFFSCPCGQLSPPVTLITPTLLDPKLFTDFLITWSGEVKGSSWRFDGFCLKICIHMWVEIRC